MSTASTPPEFPDRPVAGLASRAITGALWFALQTLVIKAGGIAAQVALAYLLLPDDFGLVGLALGVTAFADVLHQNGLAQVIVQRRADLDRIGRSVFWLSFTISTSVAVVLVAVSPLVGWLFDAPEVTALIAVLALAVPINGAGAVPRARLISRLEFRRIAGIAGTQSVTQGALSVLLAWLGLGALSLAVPVPVAAALALVLYRRSSPLGATWPPRFGAWRPLSRDTSTLASTAALEKVVEYADYIVLGFFATQRVVGLYFFAFRLAGQTASIVASNVGGVLFPALTQLAPGSVRQRIAFDRSVRLLAAVGTPFAVGLVVFGADLIVSLFDDEWRDAVRYVQILSVAAAVRSVTDSHVHLLKAQGRFRELLRWNLMSTALFLGAIVTGAAVRGALGVAIAVVVHGVAAGWIRYFLTVRPSGGTIGSLGRIVAGPTVCAVAASAGALVLARVGLDWDQPSLHRLALGIVVTGVLYVPLLRLASPVTHRELATVLRHGARGARRRRAQVEAG